MPHPLIQLLPAAASCFCPALSSASAAHVHLCPPPAVRQSAREQAALQYHTARQPLQRLHPRPLPASGPPASVTSAQRRLAQLRAAAARASCSL